jgi:hypothetical protein
MIKNKLCKFVFLIYIRFSDSIILYNKQEEIL